MLSQSLFSARLALVPLLALPATAGHVHEVAAGGGYDFTDIQSAVDAAAEGDTLVVYTGDYASFTIDGKALTVTARPGNQVHVFGTARVEDTAPGQTVLLSGLTLNPTFDWDLRGMNGLEVFDAQGPVRIESCEIRGQEGGSYYPPDYGGDAAHLSFAADVAFHSSTLTGGEGHENFGGFYWNRGGDGIHAVTATFTLHACVCLGGKGGPEDTPGNGEPGDPGHGISLRGDSLLFAQGSESTGGPESGGFGGFYGGHGLYVTEAPSHAWLLDVLLQGGAGHYPGDPIREENGGTASPLYGTARFFEAPGAVLQATPFQITARGEPGDHVFLFLSTSTDQELWWPLHGPLLVGLPLFTGRRFVGVVPASGVLQKTIALPSFPPGEEASSFFLQTYHADTATERWLSGCASVVVLAGGS